MYFMLVPHQTTTTVHPHNTLQCHDLIGLGPVCIFMWYKGLSPSLSLDWLFISDSHFPEKDNRRRIGVKVIFVLLILEVAGLCTHLSQILIPPSKKFQQPMLSSWVLHRTHIHQGNPCYPVLVLHRLVSYIHQVNKNNSGLISKNSFKTAQYSCPVSNTN
jgi:hypothetical protein